MQSTAGRRQGLRNGPYGGEFAVRRASWLCSTSERGRPIIFSAHSMRLRWELGADYVSDHVRRHATLHQHQCAEAVVRGFPANTPIATESEQSGLDRSIGDLSATSTITYVPVCLRNGVRLRLENERF